MSLHSLPLFVRLAGRPVILVGHGEAADAKRRLLERAGAVVTDEAADAALAIVVDDEAAVGRLRTRGILVNAVDRPELCDFTLPAIVDRDPVLVAIGTGGASAGLAAALRQRLEALLPAGLGALAAALDVARPALRQRLPDLGERRRALATALAAGGALDPLVPQQATDVTAAIGRAAPADRLLTLALASPDPDDLTLRQARWLASADRLFHTAAVPMAILDRARADAARIACDAPPDEAGGGLSIFVDMAE